MTASSPDSDDRPLDYRLVTPPQWWRVPLAPEHRDAAIDRLVSRQLVGEDHLPQLRRMVQEQLRQDALAAYEAGGVEMYLSTLVVGTVPLSSSLVVSYLPAGPGLPPDLEPEAEDLEGLAEILSRSSEDGVVVVSSEVALLGVGPAVRRRLRATAPVAMSDEVPAARGGVPTLGLEWVVPVPGGRGAFVMLAFSSPLVTLEEGLLDLFDAVASTFHWVDGRFGCATE